MQRSIAAHQLLYQPISRPALTPDAGTQRRETIMKHTTNQIVHFRVSPYTGEEEYILFGSDLSKSGMDYVKVCEVEVTFETPDDFNPIAAQVEALKAQELKLCEEFRKRTKEIHDQISKLTCLEFVA